MSVFFFKQKTAYEIGTGDWSSDVCSSDLSSNFKHLSFMFSWVALYLFIWYYRLMRQGVIHHRVYLINISVIYQWVKFFFPFSTISTVNIVIIFLCIGNSQWPLYYTLNQNLIGCSTLGKEHCKLIGLCRKIMGRQLWTLTCTIDKPGMALESESTGPLMFAAKLIIDQIINADKHLLIDIHKNSF